MNPLTTRHPDHAASRFSHVKPGDTAWRGDRLRDFFQYKDLGIAAATGGQVIAQLVRAGKPPSAS